MAVNRRLVPEVFVVQHRFQVTLLSKDDAKVHDQ